MQPTDILTVASSLDEALPKQPSLKELKSKKRQEKLSSMQSLSSGSSLTSQQSVHASSQDLTSTATKFYSRVGSEHKPLSETLTFEPLDPYKKEEETVEEAPTSLSGSKNSLNSNKTPSYLKPTAASLQKVQPPAPKPPSPTKLPTLEQQEASRVVSPMGSNNTLAQNNAMPTKPPLAPRQTVLPPQPTPGSYNDRKVEPKKQVPIKQTKTSFENASDSSEPALRAGSSASINSPRASRRAGTVQAAVPPTQKPETLVIEKELNLATTEMEHSPAVDVNDIDVTTYPPSLYQNLIYRKVGPQDETEGDSLKSKVDWKFATQTWRTMSTLNLTEEPEDTNYFIHQGYTFTDPNPDIHLLEWIMHCIVSNYPVLRTRFFCNPLIVDADLEALVDKKVVYEQLMNDAFVNGERVPIDASTLEKEKQRKSTPVLPHLVTLLGMSEKETQLVDRLYAKTRQWINENSAVEKTLQVLVQPTTQKHCALSFIVSSAVADERTLTWLARMTLNAYALATANKVQHQSLDLGALKSLRRMVESYALTDADIDFLDLAYAEQERHLSTKQLAALWKGQVIEAMVDSLADATSLEYQLKHLKKTLVFYTQQRDSAKKRVHELDQVLKVCIEQRRKLDAFSSQLDTEEVEVTDQVKLELLKVLVLEEFGSDQVLTLLDKNGISQEAVEAIQATTLSLMDLTEITEDDLQDLKMLSRERRKIVAFASYLRHRLRSGVEEQSRLKFSVERKISKTKRELEKVSGHLKRAQHELDMTEDTMIKYQQLLNPPLIDCLVPEARLEYVLSPTASLTSLKSSLNLVGSNRKLAMHSFSLDARILQSVHEFLNEWTLTKAKTILTATQVDRLLTTQQQQQQQQQQHHVLGVDLMQVVSLCSFAILLRHIIGFEKFVVGRHISSRELGASTAFVGPLTQCVPFKVDFTVTHQTLFIDFFTDIVRRLSQQPVSCPLSALRESLQLGLTLPCRMTFISQSEVDECRRRKLSLSDMIAQCSLTHDENVSMERVWSTDESNEMDFHVVFIHDRDQMHISLFYQSQVCTTEMALRWSEKLQAIWESIQAGPRALSVAMIISRFYHSAFSSSQLDLTKQA